MESDEIPNPDAEGLIPIVYPPPVETGNADS